MPTRKTPAGRPGAYPSPTPAAIVAARQAAGLTQAQAAELTLSSLKAWQKWEQGERAMPAAVWALFELRAGLPPRRLAALIKPR
jgi:putative transcriptional regulator